MAMIAITTISSISVKPDCLRGPFDVTQGKERERDIVMLKEERRKKREKRRNFCCIFGDNN